MRRDGEPLWEIILVWAMLVLAWLPMPLRKGGQESAYLPPKPLLAKPTL